MICVNSILQLNTHLHLCTPIQSMKLDIRFGAHKPLLGFWLPLAYITIIMMSESIFCFCVNCQMLYWPLYDLYFPVMYGNKLFEIENTCKFIGSAMNSYWRWGQFNSYVIPSKRVSDVNFSDTKVHLNRVIVTYTLESLSSFTKHNLQVTINFKKKRNKK